MATWGEIGWGSAPALRRTHGIASPTSNHTPFLGGQGFQWPTGVNGSNLRPMKRRLFMGVMAGGLAWLGMISGCHSRVSPAPEKLIQEDPRTEARMKMIREQLIGPGRGITHAGVLKAMETVPRHEFVEAAQQGEAYEDRPLPIGHGQTISQPYVVAYMTEVLDPRPEDRVLEVGTGSGYQAAILSRLVSEVFTIEIVAPLGEQAMRTLARLDYRNVHVRTGDGYQGWPSEAPFDAVIVTCAPDHVPQPLVDQLKEGGRMIIPVGNQLSQELVLLEKEQGVLHQRSVLPVRFVPMTGEAQRK